MTGTRFPSERGFTLVEMLVALAIFALIAGAALGLLRGAVTSEAALRRHDATAGQVRRMLALWQADLVRPSPASGLPPMAGRALRSWRWCAMAGPTRTVRRARRSSVWTIAGPGKRWSVAALRTWTGQRPIPRSSSCRSRPFHACACAMPPGNGTMGLGRGGLPVAAELVLQPAGFAGPCAWSPRWGSRDSRAGRP
jgi:general secretion pathway protein J